MLNVDAIARTHFTRKADGANSFATWKNAVGLASENLPFEYEGNSMIKGKPIKFVIESWGGFENASGEWTIFCAWRSTKGNVTQYIHWTWDAEQARCSNRRNYSFVN